MSDDSGDLSDIVDPRPSGSKCRSRSDQKKKRRIVMRIEFDDSEEETTSTAASCSDESDCGNNKSEDLPSCSINKKRRGRSAKLTSASNANDVDYDSEQFRRNSSQRRLNRRTNVLTLDGSSSDGSSSGSEIIQRAKTRGKIIKNIILSEDERDALSPPKQTENHKLDDAGFTSDSSSNELLEKCPICLLTFRKQEIGSPATCAHIFCANCIEAWSKNVQTCPIDRNEFDKIIVRESFENRKIVREINVDKGKTSKEHQLEDELEDEEDVTNCEICNSPEREDVMLLCDSCNQGYHIDCLTPALNEIPEGSWYCDNCFDSQDDDENEVEEDLSMLYEDIRDMGISEAHLRVTEVHQPRILRTRQNERIRAAILRRTRAALARAESTTTTTTTTTRSVGRPRNSLSTTTTTTTTTRTTRKNKSIRKTTKGRKRFRRRARQRTYVVEYDLNNFDEKFAIKTTKKVIRRRRKRRLTQKAKSATSRSKGSRMTASQRLAEQMGVKRDRTYINPSYAAGASGLSIFGNANDLEYFSESDREIDSEIQIDSGHGTAVQTSVRISNIGPQRSRKGLLLGRLQRNTSAVPSINVASSAPDILSNILDLQDRWHSATQNLDNVRINSDGTLNFKDNEGSAPNNSQTKNTQEVNPNNVTQAPMYPQGGGNQRYNNSGGGYHSNNFGNQSNYRNSGGGGGGNNQYRNSTAGMNSNSNSSMSANFNMIGRGNFNFSNPDYNSNQNQNSVFSPFNNRDRFNQRNQQQQNNNMNQRSSLPYNNNNMQQRRQQPQTQQNSDMDNQLFGGLPPPIQSQNESQLFGGLPPPAFGPQLPTQTQVQQQLPDLSVPPPVVQPALSSAVPPPPAPPAALTNWNRSLFSYAQDDDDDDSNCPNFSVYSAESQEVAKASENKSAENDGELPKEDDENEDLVQLDDDDDIPMPPENNSNQNSDLYEPENPTDEIDNESENSNKDTYSKSKDISKTDITKNETQQEDNREPIDRESQIEEVNNKCDEIQKEDKVDKSPQDTETVVTTGGSKSVEEARSPSPALSEIKLPEAEGVAANRKGVLELYDDSDWDELDIDRPKSIERAVVKETPGGEDAPTQKDEDRSYTPCLDEKNDPEDEPVVSGGTPEIESETVATSENVENQKNKNDVEDSAGIAGMDTELISDDEEHEGRNGKRRNDKRGRRDNEKSETFKKVSSKQKERNYRTDKGEKRSDRRRGSRPRSRSNSGSRSRSRIRSRSRSGSRPRQKSPRGSRRNRRRKSRSPQRPRRSRSCSNDKENIGRMRGGRRNLNSRPGRPKRRELPRYNVRNVVGLPRNFKDRYGRDTSRPPRNSRSLSHTRRRRSFSRSRSRSMSPKRNRRNSFSISPTPPTTFNRRSPRRSLSVRARRSPANLGRRSPSPRRPTSQLRVSSPLRLRSRSTSPTERVNGRKVTRRIHGSPANLRLRSVSHSPRYTPRLSRSRSRSQSLRLQQKGKKKKLKDNKKKKLKKREISKSPMPVRRISRQRDPYAEEVVVGGKRKRHRTPPAKATSPLLDEPTWSPSPSPPPIREYDNNVSWTPPIQSPPGEFPELYSSDQRRGGSKTSKKEKRKREKKKKKVEKRREVVRKDKRRARRTETPEPAPSKEVFASGNNILVSVSFNKDAANQQQPQQQTTVVTLPPTREDLLTGIRRSSQDRQVNVVGGTKKKKDKAHKRKKLDTKPVAIIDLERSPFQVHQEPADIIVLTDSEGVNDEDDREHEHHRDRHMSESGAEEIDHHHRPQIGGNSGGRSGSHHDKTPPMLDTIMEEQYEIQQTGPKTPPEPPVIKFTLLSKKQTKTRNPLHEEDDLNDDLNMGGEQDQQHRQEIDTAIHVQGTQKIGPNTPPESGPCSPDVYDPFDPTKSPSLSPRSPTPPPLDISQNSISDSGPEGSSQKHNTDEQRLSGERLTQQMSTGSGSGVAIGSQSGSALNPVELVMALMNSKQQSNSQDLANKSIESQYSASSSHMLTSSSLGGGHDDSIGGSAMHDKSDDGNSGVGGLTVLSNVILSSGKTQQSQHIPTISSPTPVAKSSQISKLPLPKVVAGSVGSSGSGIGLPSSGSNIRNGGGADDSFNDIESPYSPGSADYEDLFEPPPDISGSKRRSSKRGSGKTEVYDNLFGSSSPVGGQIRLPSYTPSAKKHKPQPTAPGAAAPNSGRKSKIVKVVKSGDDHIKVYDDVPNSAVELQVKDKFLRKLNRQERVVEEVKLILKPRFNKKQITKDDYKEIMRRAVPKICHSRSGEINPNKIKNLIEAYVKKFRSKHKKLNIINTGQVSSAVKCAAYLKKL